MPKTGIWGEHAGSERPQTEPSSLNVPNSPSIDPQKQVNEKLYILVVVKRNEKGFSKRSPALSETTTYSSVLVEGAKIGLGKCVTSSLKASITLLGERLLLNIRST